MSPLTVFLIALATSVSVGRGEVIEGYPIDPDCKPPATCANLYFYNENDVLLHIAHGTNSDMGAKWPRGVKGVSKVQTVGEYGCYTIYKRKNFRSSDLCWEHKEMLITKEAGYEKTVVGYVSPQMEKKFTKDFSQVSQV